MIMQYYTVTGDSYDNAVKKAKAQYGDEVRIISRRDYTSKGGLFSRKETRCEIVCYLPPQGKKTDSRKDLSEFEKEAKTPDPASLSRKERLDTEIYRESKEKEEARKLLEANHIAPPLLDKLLEDLPSDKDPRLVLPERIVSSVIIDYSKQVHPRHFVVFIGPTGSGKTTTLAKAAHLYASSAKSVAIITLDTYRTGAYEQIRAFADALSIPVEKASDESELLSAAEKFSWKDTVFIDTMGLSPKDQELNLKLGTLLGVLDKDRTDFIFTLSASMKEEDANEQLSVYSSFSPVSLAVTKLDETETIGNVLSFAYKASLPILFFTDGQKVPEDIRKATGELILEHLKSFGLDMKGYRKQIRS